MIWLIAVAVLAQGWVLARGASLSFALPAAAAVAMLWSVRRFLPSHADMLILMAAFGGLGMLGPVLAGAPACHLDGHRASMYLGMILLPAYPCWTQARCVLQAHREGWAHWLGLGDLAGMAIGMELAAAWMPMTEPWIHHLAMTLAMLLGMAIAMSAAAWVRRATVKTDSRGQAIAGEMAQAVKREESPVSIGQRAG